LAWAIMLARLFSSSCAKEVGLKTMLKFSKCS
jgi:hypothetical protein